MSRFPGIPAVIGDTDDDASIHLNSKVGRAKPLPRLDQKNRLISSILNSEPEPVGDSYNSLFTQYYDNLNNNGAVDLQKDGPNDVQAEESPELASESDVSDPDTSDSDYDEKQDANKDNEPQEQLEDFDDDTEVETDAEDDSEPSKRKSESPETISKWSYSLWQPVSIIAVAFVVQLVLVVVFLKARWTSAVPENRIVDNYYEINSKFSMIDDQIGALSASQKSTLNTLNSLDEQLVQIIDQSTKIQEMSLKATKELLGKYENLDTKIKQLQIVTNGTEVSDKLSQLIDVNQNIESLKEDIIGSLIEALPKHLPIYIKNNKLHYIPEFNKFLFNFIDSYIKENGPQNWQQFLKQNQQPLQEYVTGLVEGMNVKGLDKKQFEAILKSKITESNQEITSKFNNLVDNLNLNVTGSENLNGDRVLLSNLLEFLAKGSINVNYADYKLGSKILGFLTSLPNDNKSLSRKVLLGWYDYLADYVPSPETLKYNANNLLVDGGNSWQCNSDDCHVGIKLSNAVILTDLVFKTTNLQTAPKYVSIYIKPRSKQSYDEVQEYINDFKLNFNLPSSNNKYLRKFIKVKETKLAQQSINHVKLPLSLVNLKVPVRDIYLEFHGSNEEMIELFNLKVYGISEYNSFKYNQEINLIIDNLKDKIIDEEPEEVRVEPSNLDEINFAILGEESE